MHSKRNEELQKQLEHHKEEMELVKVTTRKTSWHVHVVTKKKCMLPAISKNQIKFEPILFVIKERYPDSSIMDLYSMVRPTVFIAKLERLSTENRVIFLNNLSAGGNKQFFNKVDGMRILWLTLTLKHFCCRWLLYFRIFPVKFEQKIFDEFSEWTSCFKILKKVWEGPLFCEFLQAACFVHLNVVQRSTRNYEQRINSEVCYLVWFPDSLYYGKHPVGYSWV